MSHSSFFVDTDLSDNYAKFRTNPPSSLIDKIISYLKDKYLDQLDKAIDVGCGTGQSTRALCSHFKNISGYDVSTTQISEAKKFSTDIDYINYYVSDAENLPIADSSVQLVTVSQAIHWFDIPRFYKEAQRILVPNGVLAVYVYNDALVVPDNPEKTKAIQELIDELYCRSFNKFWGITRSEIHSTYQNLVFPEEMFEDFVRLWPIIDKKNICFDEYLGFMKSWSQFQKLKKVNSDFAEKELNDFTESVAKITEVESQDLNNVPIISEKTFFLCMGRKIDTEVI